MSKEYSKANKIRTKLLLYIDNELKIQKQSNKGNFKYVGQDFLYKEEYYIIETEAFNSDMTFFEKSKNKSSKNVWNGDNSKLNNYGNQLLFSTSTNGCTEDNEENFKRKEIKYKTVCTKENIKQKINEMIAGKFNQDDNSKEFLPINRSYSYKKRREDNHDEEYLLNLCDRLKMNQKKNNKHCIKRKTKLHKNKTSKITKTRKSALINFNFRKSKNSKNNLNSNENIISIEDKPRRKKVSLTYSFYKNNNFSSCICFNPIQSNKSIIKSKFNKLNKSHKDKDNENKKKFVSFQ